MNDIQKTAPPIPTDHDLAIQAIREYSALHAYGAYEAAVDKMIRLYEAAPELLDCLKRLLDKSPECDMHDEGEEWSTLEYQKIIADTKSAIEKAEKVS